MVIIIIIIIIIIVISWMKGLIVRSCNIKLAGLVLLLLIIKHHGLNKGRKILQNNFIDHLMITSLTKFFYQLADGFI